MMIKSVFAAVLCGIFLVVIAWAETPQADDLSIKKVLVGGRKQTLIEPPAIKLKAKSWVLLDDSSGEILAEHNSNLRLPPASLTKIMTATVVAEALAKGHMSLNDQTVVSEKAWRTGGSRTFLKLHSQVSVENLLKGMMIQSGNDAAVVLAEYTAGSESAFAALMNHMAEQLGMKNSHFTNANGLPDPDEYSTAYDLSLLSQHLINAFPAVYHFASVPSFTWNGIKQYNRNRLLSLDKAVDGIKTGYTKAAGYCLAASAKKFGMRLIAIVMGAPTKSVRHRDTLRLLNWGFRFYRSHQLYTQGQVIKKVPLLFGQKNTLAVGLERNLSIAIPKGHYHALTVHLQIQHQLSAPIKKGEQVGDLMIARQGKTIAKQPLIALESVEKGHVFKRLFDQIKHWFGI